MSYLKSIDRYHRVNLFGRKENAQFSAIFGHGDFRTFLDFKKNLSASRPLNGIFKNTSP